MSELEQKAHKEQTKVRENEILAKIEPVKQEQELNDQKANKR